MEFKDQLKQLAEKIESTKEQINTEEGTKTSAGARLCPYPVP